MMQTIIVTCLIAITGAQIKLQKLEQKGVVFEKIADTLLYHNTWAIYTKMDIVNKEEIFKYLENTLEQTKTICEAMEDESEKKECESWEIDTKKKVNQIKDRLRGLAIFLNTGRPRRALINAIGKVSKILFGTMDNEDAQDISARLQELETHDKQTIHLVEKQISITKNNFNNLASEIENMTTQQKEFEKRLQKIEESAKYFHDIVGVLFLHKTKLSITTKIEQLHNYIIEQCEIITALKLHILHPILLSAEDLQNIYKEITKYEEDNHLANDYAITTQTISVRMEKLDTEIWIQITVPLIEPNIYELNHAYEIPTSFNSTFNYIYQLEAPYLVSSKNTENYIILTDKEIKEQCRAIEPINTHEVFLCQVQQARMIKTPKRHCLINLFKNNEKTTNICKHKIYTGNSELMIKLHQPNTWLYMLQGYQELKVHCKYNDEQYKLEGTGTFTLTSPCQFTVENYELPYIQTRTKTLQMRQPEIEELLVPNINSTLLKIAQVKFQTNTNIKLTLGQHHDFHSIVKEGIKEFDNLETEIKEIRESRREALSYIQNHVNSGIIIVVTILIIVIIIHKALQRKRQKQNNKQETAISTITQAVEQCVQASIAKIPNDTKISQESITPTFRRKHSKRKSVTKRIKF